MKCALQTLLSIAILPIAIGNKASAVDQATAREAWRQRLDEQAGVSYRATVIPQPLGAAEEKQPPAEVHVTALMQCDERKFRFDVKGASERFSALHLLDTSGYHTCSQKLPGTWETTTHSTLPDDSSWLTLYPFLLAHGVVPLPPLDAPKFAPRKRNETPAKAAIGGQRVTFEFRGKDPVTVQVAHESHGLIDRYEVTQAGKKLLEVRNRYLPDGKRFRLNEYTVLRFGAQGKLVGHLEGRVTECRLDAKIPLSAFTPPRPPEKLRADLLKALEKTTVVKENPSLFNVADSLRSALGDDLQVRIEDEAFLKGPPRALINVDRLNIKPGEATLSQLLLRDLRGIRVDFYLDAQGIVLIPRSEAWNYAGSSDYSAKKYGITQDGLRKTIFSAAAPDDWSDVGGPAQILTGNDGDTVMVLHTQSDHMRIEELLQKGGD